MLKEGADGFCMALADSVPGVSGGTVAFIMGFYDSFIGSIDRLIFGKAEEKKTAFLYLIKLGIGWVIGMALATLVLTSLFRDHIYLVSSLFFGFVAGSIPLILREEKENFRKVKKGILFFVLGLLLVVAVTAANKAAIGAGFDLGHLTAGSGLCLFLVGMIAICAMFLPGISGSTLLLIFGAYLPVLTAIRGIIGLQISYLPGLLIFSAGIAAGGATVVRGIRICLDRFRPQMLYLILGMMIGSFYAIVMGPTTLEIPQEAMTLSHFEILPAIAGVLVVLCMQMIKQVKKNSQ